MQAATCRDPLLFIMLVCFHWEKGEGGGRYKRKKGKSKKEENERVR